MRLIEINESRHSCPMRHVNGNCLPCGGFCTAVNDEICEALWSAYHHGFLDANNIVLMDTDGEQNGKID